MAPDWRSLREFNGGRATGAFGADSGLCRRLPVSFAISRFVVEANSAEEQLAGKVLLQDVKRYQRLFSRSRARFALPYRHELTLTFTHLQSDRIANLLAQSAGWTAHWTALEITLLTLLNSVDPQARFNGFEALQRAASLLDAVGRLGSKPGGGEEGTSIRLLATAASSSQSKDIRKVLGGLEHATTGLVAAWDEAMRRWKDLSGYIFDRAGTEEDDFESRSRVGHQRESSEVSRSPEVSRPLARSLTAAADLVLRPTATL